MIASLNQSSSMSSLDSILMSAVASTVRSGKAAEYQCRILLLIDAQAHASPFDHMPFSGEQVFNGFDAPPRRRRADLDLAEMEPELPRALLCQRDRYCDGVVAGHRFLDIADHVLIIDVRKAEIAGLQQRGICFANAVEPSDIGLDIAGPIPVPGLELVLFRVEVFLPPGNRRVLEKLESLVDAIAAGQRSGEGDAGLEHPGLTALQVIGQDIGCVD